MNIDDEVRIKISRRHNDFTASDLGVMASWWHGGTDDPLYQLASDHGRPTLLGEDYLLTLRERCPGVGRLGHCDHTDTDDPHHQALHLLYQQLRTTVPCSDGTVLARMTAQDLRQDPDTVFGTPGLLWEASLTPCEHHYRLTDSCPGCDHVEEKLEETPPRTVNAYWKVVAHVHSAQVAPAMANSSLAALHRRHLLSRYRHRVSGRHTFAAGSDVPDPHVWEEHP